MDTNNFDRQKCAYYDSKTKEQCDGARFCRRQCSLENAKIDCIPSSRGQERCSDEVQVKLKTVFNVTSWDYSNIAGYWCRKNHTTSILYNNQVLDRTKTIQSNLKVSFRGGIAINDIMLIKLERAVTYNKYVMPICFPELWVQEKKTVFYFYFIYLKELHKIFGRAWEYK